MENIAKDWELNVKFKPCTKLYIPNDKLTETIFYLNEEQYHLIAGDERLCFVEKKPGKKHEALYTYFKLKMNTPGTLQQYHRAVMTAVTSQIMAGNTHMTDQMIFRTMCGKLMEDHGNVRASTAQTQIIKNAIDKMAFTKLTLDLTESCEHGYYPVAVNNPVLVSPLLNCNYFSGAMKINGNTCNNVFIFKGKPALFLIADFKKQVLKCDVRLLDVPRQKNTVENISIKHYILQRVLETRSHYKNTVPKVTFDDIFSKCLTDATPAYKRSRLKHTVIEIFNHFKNCKLIEYYEPVLNGDSLSAVKFVHAPK